MAVSDDGANIIGTNAVGQRLQSVGATRPENLDAYNTAINTVLEGDSAMSAPFTVVTSDPGQSQTLIH